MNTLVSTEELARSIPSGASSIAATTSPIPALGEQQYAEGAHSRARSSRTWTATFPAPKTGKQRPPSAARAEEPSSPGSASRDCSPPTQVVCYDGGSGAHGLAPVVDAALGRATSRSRCSTAASRSGSAKAGRSPPRCRSSTRWTYPGRAQDLDAWPASPHVEKKLKRAALLDARAPARYRGEQEPIDPVAGRIPGAKNRFNNDNLTADGIFKQPESLRAEFEAVLGGPQSRRRDQLLRLRRRRLPQRAGDGDRGPHRLARLHRLLERVVARIRRGRSRAACSK